MVMADMLPNASSVERFNEREFQSLKSSGWGVESPEGLFGLYVVSEAPGKDLAIISVKVSGRVSIIVNDRKILEAMRGYAKKWEQEFRAKADIVGAF